jgi:hypothetical protein
MGKIISGNPEVGKTVQVVECGVSDSEYVLKMKVVEE